LNADEEARDHRKDLDRSCPSDGSDEERTKSPARQIGARTLDALNDHLDHSRVAERRRCSCQAEETRRFHTFPSRLPPPFLKEDSAQALRLTDGAFGRKVQSPENCRFFQWIALRRRAN
jgi:hypothetical protein